MDAWTDGHRDARSYAWADRDDKEEGRKEMRRTYIGGRK
jgi:hypothetical protein